MKLRYKISDEEREDAKDEIRSLLTECAKEKRLMTYQELASKMHSLRLQARSHTLFELLDSISMEEEDAGRGMLSVLVVTKMHGLPSQGFFDLAETRYRCDVSNKTAFFNNQREKVYAYWSNREIG